MVEAKANVNQANSRVTASTRCLPLVRYGCDWIQRLLGFHMRATMRASMPGTHMQSMGRLTSLARFYCAQTQFTPLHAAALRGSVEAVRLLLDAGADANAKNKVRHL